VVFDEIFIGACFGSIIFNTLPTNQNAIPLNLSPAVFGALWGVWVSVAFLLLAHASKNLSKSEAMANGF